MKYTFQELKDMKRKAAIICTSRSQADKIAEVAGANRFTSYWGFERYKKFGIYVQRGDHMSPYLGWDNAEYIEREGNIKMFPFEDVLFDLPEKVKETGKLLGYKLKKDLPDVKAGEIAVKDGMCDWVLKTYRGEWKTRRYREELLKEDTDFFEPVYEEVKAEVTLGSRGAKIRISKNGSIFFTGVGGGGRTNIEKIDDLLSLVNLACLTLIGEYVVHLNEHIRFIRVGCSTEDHLFSIDELRLIKKAHDDLNK